MLECCLVVATLLGLAQGQASPKDQIGQALDDWHDAAARADFKRYFGHLSDDSVFLGTDAAERWTKADFEKFAKPYFDKGAAWSFKATKRFTYLASDGAVAWFDEELDTPNLGPARGSGVLRHEKGTWRIVQYNLSVPIPNGIFKEVKKLIDGAKKPGE